MRTVEIQCRVDAERAGRCEAFGVVMSDDRHLRATGLRQHRDRLTDRPGAHHQHAVACTHFRRLDRRQPNGQGLRERCDTRIDLRRKRQAIRGRHPYARRKGTVAQHANSTAVAAIIEATGDAVLADAAFDRGDDEDGIVDAQRVDVGTERCDAASEFVA